MRVPNSGAFLGGKNISRERELENNQVKLFKGDIIVPEILKNVVFECKFYKNFSLRSCLKKNFSLLETWINQIETTINSEELWFLCIKNNNQGWFIVFDIKYQNDFKLENYLKYISNNNKCYILCDMKDFLFNNRAKIIQLSNNINLQYSLSL